MSPSQRQAAFPPEAEFAQVLHNPALRGSADLPGIETKPVGHVPEAPGALPFFSTEVSLKEKLLFGPVLP